jgi:hypothetical protein
MVVRQSRSKKWAGHILASELSPLNKVQKMVALGYGEEEAEALVTEHMMSLSRSNYYERLPEPEYDIR